MLHENSLQILNQAPGEPQSLGTIHLLLEGTFGFYASSFPFVLCLLKLVQVVSCVVERPSAPSQQGQS